MTTDIATINFEVLNGLAAAASLLTFGQIADLRDRTDDHRYNPYRLPSVTARHLDASRAAHHAITTHTDPTTAARIHDIANAVPMLAYDVAVALAARPWLDTNDYDELTVPWRAVIGPIHPNDPR